MATPPDQEGALGGQGSIPSVAECPPSQHPSESIARPEDRTGGCAAAATRRNCCAAPEWRQAYAVLPRGALGLVITGGLGRGLTNSSPGPAIIRPASTLPSRGAAPLGPRGQARRSRPSNGARTPELPTRPLTRRRALSHDGAT